jgi:hypothetical protein
LQQEFIVTSPATESLADGTPILDREAPLPPRAVPGSGLTLVLAVWSGIVLVVATGWVLNFPPILRRWVETILRPWFLDQLAGRGIIGLVLSALGAFYLMLATHELGHLIAGVCVGFRCRSFRVGPVLVDRPLRVSLYRGSGAVVQGVAEMVPLVTDKLAWRGVAMVAGGPFANFLTALAVLLLPFPFTAFSGLFIAISIANGVSDLVPFESRLGVSDGRRIWMLWRQPECGERWLALLRLGGELADGVLPEALSADFLAKAIAVRDASADTVKAYAIAFWAAFHQHHDADAARRLETCLAYSGNATPLLREALMSDAAVFQASRRRRPEIAEQWLTGIPVNSPHSWFRSRAEAAILEAKGDINGALNKLAETETAFLALPKNAQRETSLRLLGRWKANLETGLAEERARRDLEQRRVS